jgi:iron complex transport system substrate-binding protein
MSITLSASASRMSRRRALLLAGALPLAVAACGTSGGDGASGGTRQVETSRGPVEVPAQPRRIVSLSGALTGYLYTLDVPVTASDARVLGARPDATGFPPTWSAAAVRQGTVALPAGDLSVEAVAAQRPDLIIGGGQGFTAAQAEQNLEALSRIAPTVLVPSSAVAWQDQLALIADLVNRSDRVPALMAAYDERLARVTASIRPPSGPVAVIASFSEPKPYFVTPTAVLPRLLTELGFAVDTDALRKAGNPRLFGTGDSYTVSREIVGAVADTPNALVVVIGGRTAAQLAQDPVYAALPSFRAGSVSELPALSFRPDYAGILQTLDLLQNRFRG